MREGNAEYKFFIKTGQGSGCIAQEATMCQLCTMPWVSSPGPGEKRRKKKKDD
jgi:hypothetical protein